MPQQGVDWDWIWEGDFTPVEIERVNRLVGYYDNAALRSSHEAALLTRSHDEFVQETVSYYKRQTDPVALPCAHCDEVHTGWCPTVLGSRYRLDRSLYHQICKAAAVDVNRSMTQRHRMLLRGMIDLARTEADLHDLKARLLRESPIGALQAVLDRDRNAVLPHLLDSPPPDF